MRVLVDDLFAYATFTARPQVGPVELPALVAAVTADLGADSRVRYAGAARVQSDATLIRQLVQNLVGNALTHAGAAAQVDVVAGVTDAGWWLRVVDDGPGIPVEARERVFDPFVRLGRTGSSGLGLATCARIVEALGGRITVGDAEGGGTAFTATFP